MGSEDQNSPGSPERYAGTVRGRPFFRFALARPRDQNISPFPGVICIIYYVSLWFEG